MPRNRNPIRSKQFHADIPEDWKAKLDLALWSEVENRIPFGAQQRFLIEAIRLQYEWKTLDLTELFGPGAIVKGPKETINRLRGFIFDELTK